MNYLGTRFKITERHLSLICFVYIRESKPEQVVLHPTSVARQYGLKNWAIDLGWAEERVRVIDEDLGVTGTTTYRRNGFKEIEHSIIDEKVGAIIFIDETRLARSNSDFQNLVRLCRLYGVLFIDKESIYDPQNSRNDRMTLGIKGTFSEAESDIISERLNECKELVAREGRLVFPLPTGLVHDYDKNIALDPDESVRRSIEDVFTYFKRYGTARRVVTQFAAEGKKIPTLATYGPERGKIVWSQLSYPRALSILKDPFYAGTYVYGRRKSRRKRLSLDSRDEVTQIVNVSEEEWKVKILDAHPGYITWEQYHSNQEQLKSNCNREGSKGAPHKGSALLERIVLCGHCGLKMRIHYPNSGGRPVYVCDKKRIVYAVGRCQSVSGASIDKTVSKLLLEALSPSEVERSLASIGEFEERRKNEEKGWKLRLESAQYTADKARRRLENVEPEYTLVTRKYRGEWNKSLKDLEKLQLEFEQANQSFISEIRPRERNKIAALSRNLPLIWNAETTGQELRKRILRCLIDTVTLTRVKHNVKIIVNWQTGAVSEPEIDLRDFKNVEGVRTDARLIARIRELAVSNTDEQIAECLNSEGLRSKQGKEFHGVLIKGIRHRYSIPTSCPGHYPNGPRGDGKFSAAYTARLVNVSVKTINDWCKQGRLDATRAKPHSPWWIRLTPEIEVAIRNSIGKRRGGTGKGKSKQLKSHPIPNILTSNSVAEGRAA
jgi:DNA invertase Pin-like site-specific DNA recombinase